MEGDMDSSSCTLSRATRWWTAIGTTFALLLPLVGSPPALAASSYFSFNNRLCEDAASCRLDAFTSVPAGKTLTASRASCALRLSKGALIRHIQGGFRSGSGAFNAGPYLSPIIKNSEDGTYAYYDVSSAFLIAIAAGKKPQITLNLVASAPSIYFQCNVSGTLTP
jgi:hypothetical protein